MKKRILSFLIILSMILVLSEGMENVAEAADVDNAILLNTNAQWSKDYYITQNDNDQWYRFSIPSDGKVTIKIIHYSWIGWTLHTQDLSEQISGGNETGGTEISPITSSESEVLSKGVYYLNIFEGRNMGLRGGEGKYRVNISFQSFNTTDENAISYENAQQYLLGTEVTGAITLTDLEDWYCFNVKEKGYYNLKFMHYFGIQANLYNEDLSEYTGFYIPDGEESSPQTDIFDEILSPGTYFLKISESYNGIHGGEGKYIFSVSRLTPQNCTHKYKVSDISATYVREGYTLHICEKCRKTYKDNFTAKKKLGKGYISAFSYSGKGKIYLQWLTVSDASGYQIRYSKSKGMRKGVRTKTIKGRSKRKKTIKKLSRKKRYYVQIRAYKKSGEKVVYGKWSGKRVFKTK